MSQWRSAPHVAEIVRHYQDRCATREELFRRIERHARLLRPLDPFVAHGLLQAPVTFRKLSKLRRSQREERAKRERTFYGGRGNI